MSDREGEKGILIETVVTKNPTSSVNILMCIQNIEHPNSRESHTGKHFFFKLQTVFLQNAETPLQLHKKLKITLINNIYEIHGIIWAYSSI